MRILTNDIMRKIREKGTFQTMEEWWYTRNEWMPSGSSSNRKRMKEFIQKDKRIKSADRPNKKHISETLTKEHLALILAHEPIAIARVSTKPEPGFKRRALYASDDESTLIASYAS